MISRGLPEIRIRDLNGKPARDVGDYVLYWMGSERRLEWNFGLQRAVDWSRELDLPLLVFEPLRLGYPWASRRLHRFCLDGMREHGRRTAGARVGYFPYVERRPEEREGLLEALASRAAVVVTDDFPSFFLPQLLARTGKRMAVRLEAIDSNGLVPIRAPGREFTTAYSFRRYLQKTLLELLEEGPATHPLTGDPLPAFEGVSEEIARKWPPATRDELDDPARLVGSLPVDTEVPVVSYRGGRHAALDRWNRFLSEGLEGYAEGRRHPDRNHASGLSPYLHWGQISPHEMVHTLLDREGWLPARSAEQPTDGKRTGWWRLGPDAEAFLEQMITWRELGFNTAVEREDHESYDSLPAWARDTLAHHSDDPRPWLYDRNRLEAADTHDPLWNAAQRELRQHGVIHNYMRMLWGKKILEWSATPREALTTMIHLNNRWGVDGRDPNSTSGIFWVLGRYDRGWPERDIFGKVRYMTSDSARRKLRLENYLERFAATSDGDESGAQAKEN